MLRRLDFLLKEAAFCGIIFYYSMCVRKPDERTENKCNAPA